MKSTLILLLFLGLGLLSPSVGETQVTATLDGFWAEMARAVEEGDFEGYGRLYHPDAVLVSLGSETSRPIAQALARWEQGFLDTHSGEAEAGVTFRFTQRIHDDMTAHETGMFRYTLRRKDGNETVATVHFEALLVRKDGTWLTLMEYQKQPATEEEWEKVNQGHSNTPAALPPELEPLAFLVGEWLPDGTGQPGEASGKTEFSRGLLDRVILRQNYADYPAGDGKPGSRHEDLMVIYAPPGDSVRADYYDSEGHVIRYIVQVPEASQAILLSELKAGQPRFRLTYRLEATGVLKGAFDIAPPDEPAAFNPYLAWESRKAEGADN